MHGTFPHSHSSDHRSDLSVLVNPFNVGASVHSVLNLGQDHLEEAQAARIVNVAPQLKINFDDINGVHRHNCDKATKLAFMCVLYVLCVCPKCSFL